MRIGYFDCSSGISGDMILGALIDAGLKENNLSSGLQALNIKNFKLSSKKVKRAGLMGTKVELGIKDQKKRIGFVKIGRIIEDSVLDREIKDRAWEIIERISRAEALVHGEGQKIYLGYIDSIDLMVDVVGSLIGIKYLGIEEISSSPINTGSGFINTHHGRLPVPAPATAALLKGAPIYSNGIPHELTTPTGAAIITTIADSFGHMPLMKLNVVGSGAGSLDIASQSNLLRLFIGKKEAKDDDSLALIETNIDDMNPQIYEYLMERLFDIGALDVFLTPIIMKKGRPGIILSVLAKDDLVDRIKRIIFDETTSIGIRISEVRRKVLERSVKRIMTSYGPIRVKIIGVDSNRKRLMPEYEDIKKIARSMSIPFWELMEKVRKEIGDGKT